MAENHEHASDLVAVVSTKHGDIRLRLFPKEAPLTVLNFVNLARRGYYDGLTFHRVMDDFMIQGGDPTGSGRGGPGYQFRDECCRTLVHDAPGTLSMANAGPDTNGSQFFITHVATPWLDDRHTVFGKIISGQDAVNAVQRGDAIIAVTVEGDVAPLFRTHEKQLERWNKTLDENYPTKKQVAPATTRR